MKATLKEWIFQILRRLAQRRLARINPTVVGVTGSAGKTGSKEAIAAVLERRLKVKKNEGSMNSEFGVALTLLDQKSGYSSFSKWLSILIKSMVDSFKTPEPYEVLVMEMGVDAPGNMDDILKVLRPDIMVFLNVKDVHRGEGQFPNRKAIFQEKSKALYAVPKDGWAILNGDDNFVKQLNGKLPCNTMMIGKNEDCDLCAKDIEMSPKGLSFTLAYEDKEVPVELPHVLGDCHTEMALAAIAVGFLKGLPWSAIEMALKEFKLPPGRMNRIDGKNGSLIIDSSYNAAPATMEAALNVLKQFHGRRIAALGTMNELGELSESSHLKIGKMAADCADVLIAVGKHASQLAEGAHRAGMSSSLIHSFKNSKEAGEFLAGMVERNDIILAKGSQNHVRMEHLVKACMKEPEQARKLLVRQEPYWLTKL